MRADSPAYTRIQYLCKPDKNRGWFTSMTQTQMQEHNEKSNVNANAVRSHLKANARKPVLIILFKIILSR